MNGKTEVDQFAEIVQLGVFDLEGWDYICPASRKLDIYARGNERVIIDRETGRLITKYKR